MKEIAQKVSSDSQFSEFNAQEWMDNGTNLDIAIKVDKTNGNAVFDFSGTGLQVNGNLNTPRAITLSAIIYCIRCMLKHDIPLNQVTQPKTTIEALKVLTRSLIIFWFVSGLFVTN